MHHKAFLFRNAAEGIMRIWKIPAPKQLVTEERDESVQTPTQAKVKVTNVLLSPSELRIWRGSVKPAYPVVPGRFAVGVVSEAGEGCVSVEKNTRVYIHDTVPCGTCEQCLAGHGESCAAMQAAGIDREGYLRDFAVTEEADLSPLPPSVSDTDALFVGIISLCEAVIDRLDAPKGTHIAVFGAGEIGNILCQLLIYHQAVPILIDPDEARLSAAAACGIYYTLKADEELLSNIARITGGRMAAHSVFTSYNPMPADIPYEATAAGGTVVYTGFGFPAAKASLKPALDRRLTLTTVTNDFSNSAAAINLLVNKAVNLAPFGLETYPVAEAEQLFAARAEELAAGKNVKCCVLNLM